MMISAEFIKGLKATIEEMPVFKDTKCKGEEYLTYHAVELFGTIIVREEWSSKMEDATAYYVFEGDVLRGATEVEDEILRCADLNDVPFREMADVAYVTSKGGKDAEE